MAWFWWWGSGGTPPPPDPQALLAEAAVRFDFSQYDDIDDMVDVNGGWGPIFPVFNGTPEFTAAGLRLTDVDGTVTPRWRIEGVASPLITGSDGFTIVNVLHSENVAENPNFIAPGWEMASDGLNDFVPDTVSNWTTLSEQADSFGLSQFDISPPGGLVVNESGVPTSYSTGGPGTYIQITVFDVAAEEAHLTLVTDATRFEVTVPFGHTPGYASDPRVVDSVYNSGFDHPSGITLVEWDGWNRALSDAEVDALIAYFQA